MARGELAVMPGLIDDRAAGGWGTVQRVAASPATGTDPLGAGLESVVHLVSVAGEGPEG